MKKNSVCAFLASILVAGCFPDTHRLVQAASSGASDVVIGQDKLGDYWCLKNPGPDSGEARQARARIREVALDEWDAHETRLQSGEYLSCDAGPFTFVSGGACAGLPDVNPATDLLVKDSRIAIERAGAKQKFKVTFKNPSGVPYPEIESKVFEADSNARNGRYKWLAGSVDVSGSGGKVAYDVFIYIYDDSSATQRLAKSYRVEFFRKNSRDCITEEPNNPANLSGPYTPGSDACPDRARSVTPLQLQQAPIGDGHHGDAAQGQCTY